MAPDTEELIKKVNTLTLDKNRLRQKLTQLSLQGNQIIQQSSLSATNQSSTLQSTQGSTTVDDSAIDSNQGSQTIGSSSNNDSNQKSPLNDPASRSKLSASVIAGIECSSSCEEDLLFMNDLYRKRLDEYSDSWNYIQSKCTSLLSELNALQKHYGLLKREKLDIEEQLRFKCDEVDKINNELKTIALNYETQLSAMSDHLTMIAGQVKLDDN